MKCDCGVGSDFSSCCEPLILGRVGADSAEQLMRSRYSAFVHQHMDYVFSTHHPSTRKNVDMEGNSAWAKKADWKSLEILRTEAGRDSDSEGLVEFIAEYEVDGQLNKHHELSQFKKEKGKWFFYDGKFLGAETFIRDQPKVRRNDPCPCGSGKKYKKCCG